MKKIYNNRVLTTYFILQPLIDIITGLMKYYFDISISLAMIVRFMFIIYCGIYLLQSKNKKVYIFLAIWFVYSVISITGNFIIKDNFSIMHQAYNLFRMIYFQIVLLFFYLYMKKFTVIFPSAARFSINKTADTKPSAVLIFYYIIMKYKPLFVLKPFFQGAKPEPEKCLLRGKFPFGFYPRSILKTEFSFLCPQALR